MFSPFTTFRAGIWLTLLMPLVLPGCATTGLSTAPVAPTQEAATRTAPKAAYIIQYRSAAEAAEVVRDAGGEITHELTVIRAVGAELDEAQVAQLRETHNGLRVFADRAVSLDAYLFATQPDPVFSSTRTNIWIRSVTRLIRSSARTGCTITGSTAGAWAWR